MPNWGTEINCKVFSCLCNPRAATCNTWVNLICKFLFLYVGYIRDWGQWSSYFRLFTCSLRLGRLSLYHFIVLSCWRQMYEDNRDIIKFTFRFNAITVWTHKPRRGWHESMLSPKSLFSGPEKLMLQDLSASLCALLTPLISPRFTLHWPPYVSHLSTFFFSAWRVAQSRSNHKLVETTTYLLRKQNKTKRTFRCVH